MKRFVPGGPGALAEAIAMALSHPFGSGGARYRRPTAALVDVDTVPFGCFPRRVFERVGLFDPELVRNQDDEFNARLIRAGERVLLVPGVEVAFFARTSLRNLARMHFQYGLFKPLVVRKLGAVPTARQLVPAVFLVCLGLAAVAAVAAPRLGVPGLLGLVGVYAGASLGVTLSTAWRTRRLAAGLMPLAFGVMHVGYAWGYLRGLRAGRTGASAIPRPCDMPLTR
jgi:hypothetical protein